MIHALPQGLGSLVLNALLPQLGTKQRECLTLALSEEDPPSRALRLVELVPIFRTREVLRSPISTIRELWDDQPNRGFLGEAGPRAAALAQLAPHLDRKGLEDALEIGREVRDHFARSRALVRVAASLEGEPKLRALRAAFDAIWTVRHDDSTVFDLEKILPHMRGEMIAHALDAVLALPKRATTVRLRIFNESARASPRGGVVAPSIRSDCGAREHLDACLPVDRTGGSI